MLINNRYQVIRSLGEGGFGQAYLAEDTQMPSRRQCVVKQLKPITSNTEVYELVQARFQREAAILEQLGENHLQIPRLYAYFTEDKNFYLVQEWIEGETLESLPLPQPEMEVRSLLTSLLPVLEFVHSKGIIHRDIKPGNIILKTGSQQPVLIDFGAVKETIKEGNSAVSSIVIGTPGYMAAEQGAGRPLASSDLYSLALTAVYLLTGKSPQELPSDSQTGEIQWQHTASGVSPELVAVLTKAIQYHPRDRYSSAQEMLAAMTAISQKRPPSAAALQPTVIRPPASTRPITHAQLTTAEQPNTSAPEPTQIEAPEISQPIGNTVLSTLIPRTPVAVNQPKKKSDRPWYYFAIPVALGLLCLAIGSIAFNSRQTTGDDVDPSPPTQPASKPTTTEPAIADSSIDKCFDLVAYDLADNSVNVRDSPNGNVIETIPNLSIVQPEAATGIQAGWNNISVKETDTKGYILGDLLYQATYQVKDPEDSSANLRREPNGDIITAVANGTEVAFLGTDGSWTQVRLANGQSGYVSTPRLTYPNCP